MVIKCDENEIKEIKDTTKTQIGWLEYANKTMMIRDFVKNDINNTCPATVEMFGKIHSSPTNELAYPESACIMYDGMKNRYDK